MVENLQSLPSKDGQCGMGFVRLLAAQAWWYSWPFPPAMGFYPLEKYVGNQNMARPSFRFSPFGPLSEFKIFTDTLPETNTSRTPEKNVAWNRSSLPFEMVWNGPLLRWWQIRLFSFSAVFKVHVLQQLWHCGVFTLSSLCANSCAWSARKSSVSSHDFVGPLFIKPLLKLVWVWRTEILGGTFF